MIYDDLANRLSSDYSIFLFALTGRYQGMRSPGIAVTPHAISKLRSDVGKMGNDFIDSAIATIDAYAQSITVAGAERSHVVRKKEVVARLRGAVAENLHQVVKMAITGVGGVGSLLRGAHGATGMLVQQTFSKIEFRVSDSVNRKWPADKWLHVVVRDFAYQSWIDAEAARYASAGHNLMQTTKGEVFSLLDTPGHASFEAIRATAFHPNATSEMVPYVTN